MYPGAEKITHHASKESTEHGGAAFYWVTDEPLCKYLGVAPTEEKFEPAHFTKEVSELSQCKFLPLQQQACPSHRPCLSLVGLMV